MPQQTEWPATQGPPAPPAPPPPTGSATPRPPDGHGRPPGAKAGFILIVLGLALLAGRLLPGIAWWSLWPLVIVLAGAIKAFTPGEEGWGIHRMFDGLVTVTIGLLLLGITTGVIALAVLWQLASLWPVLLIALGLELLGKGLGKMWVRALGSLVVIAAIVYAAAVSGGLLAAPQFGGIEDSVELREPVGPTQSVDLRLDAGAGEVFLEGGATGLVDASVSSPWGKPEMSVKRSGESADVSLSMGSADRVVLWPGTRQARMEARLSKRVLWDIVATTGVSRFDADLAAVNVRSLEFKPGVADCTIRLGRIPRGQAESTVLVQSGVSSVVLRLPRGVSARIESESGLTAHSIDSFYVSKGERVWESPGYATDRDTGQGVWLIRIKSAIGSVRVDAY